MIGTAVGLVAGYFGGLVDTALMWLVDLMLTMPSLLLLIVLATILPPSILTIPFVIGIIGWTTFARTVRGEVLTLRERDYVQAARALGRRDLMIAFRHILPNCVGPLLVQASFIFAYAILAEAILGFLGVGVPPYVPSWGNVIASGKNVIREAFWVSLFPGLALTLAGLSLNLLGDGLRDILDPRLRVQ